MWYCNTWKEGHKKKVRVEDASFKISVEFGQRIKRKGERYILRHRVWVVEVAYQPGGDCIHCQIILSESYSTIWVLLIPL